MILEKLDMSKKKDQAAKTNEILEENDVNPESQEAALDETFQKLQEEKKRLMQELEQAQAKAQENLDGWQRALADFSNYKRRVERDQSQTYQNAIGMVVKRYLPVLDDLERALNNRPKDSEGAAWASGIELIYRKLATAIEAEGVMVMDAEGQMFDPNFHEAISQEPNSEFESGQIIDVLQKGYLIGDRVIRPAIVRVAE
jgi:molecular chaperone GrpE